MKEKKYTLKELRKKIRKEYLNELNKKYIDWTITFLRWIEKEEYEV